MVHCVCTTTTTYFSSGKRSIILLTNFTLLSTLVPRCLNRDFWEGQERHRPRCLQRCVPPKRRTKNNLAHSSSPILISHGLRMARKRPQFVSHTQKLHVSSHPGCAPHYSCLLQALFCSKEGAAQVRLKLGLINDEAGHNFTFTSPQAVAYVERETFKQELTNIISRNRSAAPTPVPAQKPTPLTMSTPAKTPGPVSTSRATSVSSDGRTPILSGTDAATDFRLRKKVLLSNPELLALHKELVMSGHITESEFWDGREVLFSVFIRPFLVLSVCVSRSTCYLQRLLQRPRSAGVLVSSSILDLRPWRAARSRLSSPHSWFMISSTSSPSLQKRTMIMSQTRCVLRDSDLHVSQVHRYKLSEAEFWKRYFQSKLFNAHRASIRSSAAQHVVKDDPIFDKYLEKDDDGTTLLSFAFFVCHFL